MRKDRIEPLRQVLRGLVSQPMELLVGKLGCIACCVEVLAERIDGGFVDGAALLINNEERPILR